MSKTAVLLEFANGKHKSSNVELLTLAQESDKVIAVVFGQWDESFSDDLKKYGAHEVIVVDGVADNPEVYATICSDIIKSNDVSTFLGAHSAVGKDLLPRIAAHLDAPLVSDCVSVTVSTGVVVKPLYAGKTLATIETKGNHKLFTVRPNSVEVQENTVSDILVKNYEGACDVSNLSIEIKDVIQSVSKEIDLTEAKIVVSGGRGVGSEESMKIIDDFARAIGAAAGASRAAVDAGYAPHSRQVGQTGKTVNPQLYIACGISGAIQHLAGMKTSKFIVAINTDPDAPIFKKADFGIVADLFEAIPLLQEELQKKINN